MKIFLNRGFAVVICVVVIIFATLLGLRGSLNRLARDVEAGFFMDVVYDESGRPQPGINWHLNNRMACALGFAALMEKHSELADDAEVLLSARRGLLDARSISQKFSANEVMQRAFVDLADKAKGSGLSQNEKDDIEQYTSTFLGAQAAIQNNLYNQKAQSFMDKSSYLAQLLRPILFIRSPQVFA